MPTLHNSHGTSVVAITKDFSISFKGAGASDEILSGETSNPNGERTMSDNLLTYLWMQHNFIGHNQAWIDELDALWAVLTPAEQEMAWHMA